MSPAAEPAQQPPRVTFTPAFPAWTVVPVGLGVAGVASLLCTPLLMHIVEPGEHDPGSVALSVSCFVPMALGIGLLAAAALLRNPLRIHRLGWGWAIHHLDLRGTHEHFRLRGQLAAIRLALVNRWFPLASLHSVYVSADLGEEADSLPSFYADSRGRKCGAGAFESAPLLSGAPAGSLVQACLVRRTIRIAVHGARPLSANEAAWACRFLVALVNAHRELPAVGFRENVERERREELEVLARRLDLAATDGASPWATFHRLMSVWLAEDPMAPADPRGNPPTVANRRPNMDRPRHARMPTPARWDRIILVLGCCSAPVWLAIVAEMDHFHIPGHQYVVAAGFMASAGLIVAFGLSRNSIQQYHPTRGWLSRARSLGVWLPTDGESAPRAADFVVVRRWRGRATLHSLYAEVPLRATEGWPEFYVDNRGRQCGDEARLVADLLDDVGPYVMIASTGSLLRLAIHGGATNQAELEWACARLNMVLHCLQSAARCPPNETSGEERLELARLWNRFSFAPGPFNRAFGDFERVRSTWEQDDKLAGQRVNGGHRQSADPASAARALGGA
ncbi:MAG: hypothetical protein U0414_27765 [Polyangiaceae bacterium]